MPASHLIRHLACLVLIAGTASITHATTLDPAQCAFVAFVEETDPAGLNVRAAPNARSKVLGKLPPVWVDKVDNARVRVRVEVTASSNGWFRIQNASDEENLTEQPARPTYSGEGWVSGRKLLVKPQTSIGRTRPAETAPVGLQLQEQRLFDTSAFSRAGSLVGCSGSWVHVEFVENKIPTELRQTLQVSPKAREGLPHGRFRLWLDKICGAQETSCDGL